MGKQYTRLIQRQPAQVLAATPRNSEKQSVGAKVRANAQAALLHRNEMARSMTAVQRQQLVLQLQRWLGNSRAAGFLKAPSGANSGRNIPHVLRQTENAPPSEKAAVDPVPAVTVTGEPHEVVAFARAPNIRLQGLTRARFNGGRSRTESLTTEPGSGCKRCRGRNCVHVTGTVVTEYHVTTTVTLPRASSFRRLTRCQRERVQDAIDNVLAPHEQDHVDAFETYNGTTEQPFDLNLCRNQLPGVVRKMVTDEERPRRADAKAQSAALDPFNFNVDLDCED
jgi:hypothetical protein